MSNAQQVIVSLSVVSSTCAEAVQSLSTTSHLDSPPELAVILKDYTSLLSLVYSSTTKIGLALKPDSPTHSAAITPLHDIAKQTASLAHCVSLVDAEKHGSTLRAEIIAFTKDVFEAISSLSQTLLAAESSDQHFGPHAGGEYMVRIGTVHDYIERAKKHSRDNAAAADKKFKLEQGSLSDALQEVSEMIEDDGQNGCSLDEDDGWDELGLGPTQKMSKEELERAKKAHNLLKLTVLLHKHVRTDLLSNCSVGLVDSLAETMVLLSPAMDDLVATLYSPQDVERVKSELSAFTSIVTQVQALTTQALDLADLSVGLASVKLHKQDKAKNEKAWTRNGFTICFKQIRSIADTIVTDPE